jgi:hypothetical protein
MQWDGAIGGRVDLFIIETIWLESSSTHKSHLLFTMPILSAVQIVTGETSFGKTMLGPW